MSRRTDLETEFAAPALIGLRQAWTWRPLVNHTPASVADTLRRASMGDAHDFLIAAADIEEKDLHYRAAMQTRKLSVAGLPWDLQPADDSAGAHQALELCKTAFAQIDLPSLFITLLDAIAKGYSVAEIVWDTRGQSWLPSSIIPREAHWFQYDRETGRSLRLVDGSYDGQVLPNYKFIIHTPALHAGIPLLGGLARSALWAWVFKSYALRDWAGFAELYGQPIRLGKYDPAATREDIAVLKRAVFDIGSDAGAVIPAGMAIEFVESGGKTASSDLYQALIEYLDRQVSKAVLGQTLTSDSGKHGSLAQASVHNEVRTDLIHADARALIATLTRDLLTPLVRLNLGETAPIPRLNLMVEEPEDMAALADQLSKLVPLGLDAPLSWVHAKWGIPEAAAEEAVLGQSLVPPISQATNSRTQCEHAHSAAGGTPADFGQDITPITPHTQQLQDDSQPHWVAIMDKVKQLVDDAHSLAELRDTLLNSYSDLPSDSLSEVLAMGFAAAELAGRYDLHQESN